MKIFVATSLLMLSAFPALAHHPMGGTTPTTFFEGLASGIGHPVIGIDHLAFVILVGLAAAANGARLLLPAAFAVSTLLGCGLHLADVSLPWVELVVSGSVILLGFVLLAGAELALPKALLLSVLAGLFHGWAYGEAILGAEDTPLVAYLAGFGATQFVIAAAVAALALHLGKAASTQPQIGRRLTAAICAGVGVAVMLETIEAMAFAT